MQAVHAGYLTYKITKQRLDIKGLAIFWHQRNESQDMHFQAWQICVLELLEQRSQYCFRHFSLLAIRNQNASADLGAIERFLEGFNARIVRFLLEHRPDDP